MKRFKIPSGSSRVAPGERNDPRPPVLSLLWKMVAVMSIVGLVSVSVLVDLCMTAMGGRPVKFSVTLVVLSIPGGIALATLIVASAWELVWDRSACRAGRGRLLELLEEREGAISLAAALGEMHLTRAQLRRVLRRLGREGLVEMRTRPDVIGSQEIVRTSIPTM